MSDKIHIIGIGDDGLDGLTEQGRQLIAGADLLVGAEGSLERVGPTRGERFVVGANLDAAVRKLSEAASRRTVVLASGDPMFYGVARYLCGRLGKDRFEVLPHVSSMQLAFARVKESWEEAYLTDLSSRPLATMIERIRVAEKVGLFTSDACTPAHVARTLIDHGLDYFTAYVCENLGSPDERVTHVELNELLGQEFAPLNVMILVRKPNVPDRPTEAIGRRLFGNPDEIFRQSQPKHGLLTPQEVRAIALAELDLGPRSVVWDIGAGSGSVAIEAAQLAREGTVYGIEMDGEDLQLMLSNAEQFGVKNLVPVLGRAPEAWHDLPDPDAIFVGGSGRGISRIVLQAYERLKRGGRLVANVGSIENLAESHENLNRQGCELKVRMLNLARGVFQLERVRFEALNPSFLLSVVKPAGPGTP